MANHKFVYIEWADAISPREGTWMTEEEAIKWADDDLWYVKEAGWILKETKEYILLSTRSSILESKEVVIQYGGIFKIPKTWILNRKEVKI